MMKSTHDTTRTFTPKLQDMGRFYATWHTAMVGKLLKRGCQAEAEDAVSEAFLKVFGLSQTRRMREDFKDVTEESLFNYILQQAVWILGQEREKAEGWSAEALHGDTEDGQRLADFLDADIRALDAEDRRESRLRRRLQRVARVCREGLERTQEGGRWTDKLDDGRIKRDVRRLVREVLREARVSEASVKAFVRYVLDEESPEQVVTEVWGRPASPKALKDRLNRLYVLKNRAQATLARRAPARLGDFPRLGEFLGRAA